MSIINQSIFSSYLLPTFMANLDCFSASDEITINNLPIDDSSRSRDLHDEPQPQLECPRDGDTHRSMRPRKRRTHSVAEGRYRDGLRFRMTTLQVLVENILQQNPELLTTHNLRKGSSKPAMLTVARELLKNLHDRIGEATQTRLALQAEFDEHAAKANCDVCPTAAYARKHYFPTMYATHQVDDQAASSDFFRQNQCDSE